MLLLRFVRSVAFWTCFFSVNTFLFCAFPVTLLNPLWRALGIPETAMPMSALIPYLARLILFVGGVDVKIDDKASSIKRSSVVYMYNHSSNLDAFVVQASVQCKFIYKKELQLVPIFGWVMFLYNHISIDRGNREKAIESLNRAVRNVVNKHQNIAIAPEGTRSKTGELQPFKKGPFHLALQAKATVVPIVIRGSFDLLPPKHLLLKKTSVLVTLLPPIEPLPDETPESLSSRVRAAFEDELSTKTPPQCDVTHRSGTSSVVFLLLFWQLVAYFWR